MKEIRQLEVILAETQEEVRESRMEESAVRKEAEAKRQECQYLQEQLSARAGEVDTPEENRPRQRGRSVNIYRSSFLQEQERWILLRRIGRGKEAGVSIFTGAAFCKSRRGGYS